MAHLPFILMLHKLLLVLLLALPLGLPLHAAPLAALPIVAASAAASSLPAVMPAYILQPENVAVVINDDDANSVAVGEYYREARSIPEKNMVHIRIASQAPRISSFTFETIKKQIEARLHPDIQAIVLVWTTPYAVECNSITSALTLGFDAEQCTNNCGTGKASRYFNSTSVRPFTDLGLRPSMLLPVQSVAQAKALIDRGIRSEFRIVPASAYFLVTSDAARSVRSPFFPKPMKIPSVQLEIKTLKADSIENIQDLMFYQTGLRSVPRLETLHFLPGALADHLTSTGGDLLGTDQMSSLRWLEAGATASYGTVSEPCNHVQKFPNPTVLLHHYLSGASAVEAYWKSVAWPAQGLFIGEPLAAPYRRITDSHK